MTEFSVNTEFENLIKAMLIDQGQQQQTEEMTTVPEKKTNQKKVWISFKITTLSRRNFSLSPTQPRGSNQEIFYRIFHMFVSTKRSFIKKSFCLTIIHF